MCLNHSTSQSLAARHRHDHTCVREAREKYNQEVQDMTEKIDAYREKRDIVYNGLKDTFNVSKPGGAFYIFPEAPEQDGDAFVRKAIDNNVLIIPGSVFSDKKSNFRISFAAKNETLKKGIEVLKGLAD